MWGSEKGTKRLPSPEGEEVDAAALAREDSGSSLFMANTTCLDAPSTLQSQ